jgi:hypothetical protein
MAFAGEIEPTVFQRGIQSWMGVIALLADDGEDVDVEEHDEFLFVLG